MIEKIQFVPKSYRWLVNNKSIGDTIKLNWQLTILIFISITKWTSKWQQWLFNSKLGSVIYNTAKEFVGGDVLISKDVNFKRHKTLQTLQFIVG